MSDYASNSHTLFTELDAGKIIDIKIGDYNNISRFAGQTIFKTVDLTVQLKGEMIEVLKYLPDAKTPIIQREFLFFSKVPFG